MYNLICCILILYIQVKLCVQKKLESEVQTLSFLLHQSEEQYRQSNENIMLLNLKCHDLKHQIREYTQKHTLDEEYIKDLENIVNIYDSPVKTGNDALDLILTGKESFVQKESHKPYVFRRLFAPRLYKQCRPVRPVRQHRGQRYGSGDED